MELRHLRCFVAVAQHLSFTAAARSLHLAQAALSETIKNLENELGFELLARNRRSVRLTAAGASFLRDTQRILRDVNDASRSANLVARGETGRLTIGFLGATAAPYLPRLLRDFKRRFPGVEIGLFDGTPRELTNALNEGRIDVAITRVEEDGAYQIPVERFQILDAELCVAFARDHPFAGSRGPLSIRMISGEPLVLPARTSAPWFYDTVIASCRKVGFVPRTVMTPNHMSTVMVLVEAGIGISLVSETVSHSVAGRRLRFRPLKPRLFTVPALMVWPRGVHSPTTRAFVALVQELAPTITKTMRLSRSA